jgi:hypothetical protein
LAYKLTVMGWPVPVPDRAISTPKETEVTSYSWPPVKVFMLKARQKLLSVVVTPPSLLHATEFPSSMFWLVDSVIVAGHVPFGCFGRGASRCKAPLPAVGTVPRALTKLLDPNFRGRLGRRTSLERSWDTALGASPCDVGFVARLCCVTPAREAGAPDRAPVAANLMAGAVFAFSTVRFIVFRCASANGIAHRVTRRRR